jgi:hypothetical protein
MKPNNKDVLIRFVAACAIVAVLSLSTIQANAAGIAGKVQGAGSSIAGSTVTLYAAGSGAPTQFAQGKTDDNGVFNLDAGQSSGDSILYVVAKGGTPKASATKSANDAIALIAVLGASPPQSVTVNEFTTVASVWTSAQFLKGDVLSGPKLGLRIAAGNVPNFIDLQTGGWGSAIQDPLNSGQTPTMANFATLADLLAGCVTQVKPDACSKLFAATILPKGDAPKDTLTAAESIARYPWYHPAEIYALLNEFYPVPKGENQRPAPFVKSSHSMCGEETR